MKASPEVWRFLNLVGAVIFATTVIITILTFEDKISLCLPLVCY